MTILLRKLLEISSQHVVRMSAPITAPRKQHELDPIMKTWINTEKSLLGTGPKLHPHDDGKGVLTASSPTHLLQVPVLSLKDSRDPAISSSGTSPLRRLCCGLGSLYQPATYANVAVSMVPLARGWVVTFLSRSTLDTRLFSLCAAQRPPPIKKTLGSCKVGKICGLLILGLTSGFSRRSIHGARGSGQPRKWYTGAGLLRYLTEIRRRDT